MFLTKFLQRNINVPNQIFTKEHIVQNIEIRFTLIKDYLSRFIYAEFLIIRSFYKSITPLFKIYYPNISKTLTHYPKNITPNPKI